MQARSSVHLGNAGEHLVMAHLLAQNFQAFMADRGNPAFDISVVDGHRHSLIRVKTTSSESVMWSRKPSGSRYWRTCGKRLSSQPAPISIRPVLVPQTALHL